MPWFRVDDSFHCHPKVMAAGNEAIGLYVRCGSYAAQHLTDGFIPENIADLYGAQSVRVCTCTRRMAGGTQDADDGRCARCGGGETLAETLVKTRLWRRVRGGWKMPDFLDYNRSKDEVLDERKSNAKRQARHRNKQKTAGQTASGNGVTNTVSHTVSNARPVPSRPVPSSRVKSVGRLTQGDARENDDDHKITQAVIDAIHANTGRTVEPDWAERVARQILAGRSPNNPVAYIAASIRDDPDRYLPTPTPPNITELRLRRQAGADQ
jgi:hypothetical protein